MLNIWIQYVASQYQSLPDDVTDTMRLPFGGFTWLLSEEFSCQEQVPSLGYRPRIHRTNSGPDGDQMQSRPGDWVVEAIERYSSGKHAIQMFAGSVHLNSYDEIVVCTCRFDPIPVDRQTWQDIPRVVVKL